MNIGIFFCDLCDEYKKEYSEYQRNEIANNFAKTFMEMLVGVEIQQSFSNAEITLKCIKLKKQYLNELLNFAIKNRQNIEILKLEATKHEDWFQKEIEKLQL